MQDWNKKQGAVLRPHILIVPLLLVTFTLVGCSRLFGEKPKQIAPQVSANTTTDSSASQNASLALHPASGYGGLYVQVSGEGWPQNMTVLVTLEDAQGRSETLAASDTDSAGKLNTGFLFPIDERWLASGSPSVVTTTADGSIEAKTSFTVVPPGSEVAMTSPLTTTGEMAAVEEELAHKTVLPMISSTGSGRESAQSTTRATAKRNQRSPSVSTSPSGALQVNVDVSAGGSIDCNNGQQWITVVILSGGGFDATSIDPGSVTVSGGPEFGYRRDAAANTLIALGRPDVRSNLADYTWKWHTGDADGDGAIDLIMEFRLDYTDLTCEAAVVAVRGRTKDGKSFEGIDQTDMLVLERG